MIENNRLLHIIGVARLMKENALKFNLNPEEMFTLGFLHDIGYEFGDNLSHPKIGGEILKNQSYKYYNEIIFHGDINSQYQSDALNLLNWCDMKVDGYGNIVSFEERLLDIKNRHGENSFAYKNCVIMVERLKNIRELN